MATKLPSLTTAAIALALLGCDLLHAQQGDLGVGGVVGNPIAATVKYFITNSHAVDGGFGLIGDDATVYADYLWHAWQVFPQPKEGKIGAYVGLGGQLRWRSDDTLFGLRTVAGLGYWPATRPIELFAELGPVIELSPSSFVQVDGGVGIRYYFKSVANK